MEGKTADEGYEIYLIDRMSTAERWAGFRAAVEAAMSKWLVPLDRRRSLRAALDYDHVVASQVFDAEVRRCAIAEAEVARLRALVFTIDNAVMNTKRPGELYDAVRDLCATEIMRSPQATDTEKKT